jgi:SAM-dependent methyltransferase
VSRVLTALWARLPQGLRPALRRIALRTRAARKLVWREKGVEHELEFWERWFATGGYLWKDDFERRLDPDALLEERLIVERLPEVPADPVAILDVGAGPLTFLGKRYPGRSLRITPVDALADEYDRLLREFELEPPVRTLLCSGEELLTKFAPETFDIAYARNSLDHSYDPLAIIRNMISVVKPGGFVITRHVRTEGEHQTYSGFHQWNFDIEDGRLVLWNKATKHDVTKAVDGVARAEAFRDDEGGGDWVVCVLQKARSDR